MFIPVPFSENIFLKTQIQFKTPERGKKKKITTGQISLCLYHKKNQSTSLT